MTRPVFSRAPHPPAKAIERISPFLLSFIRCCMPRYTNHGTTPTRMRGMKQMTRLRGLPFGVPGTGTSGLNAKDSTAGCSVLLRKLTRPNIKPSTAPYFGPRSRQPTITGTYSVVALISPSGIMPRGVNPRTKMMAVNSANRTKSRYFAVALLILITSCCCSRRIQRKFPIYYRRLCPEKQGGMQIFPYPLKKGGKFIIYSL